MAKRRGNPNWGKPEPIGPVVPTVTSFELVVKEYKLTPDQYVRSTRLREWARRNKNSKYIPEALLEACGFEIEATLYPNQELVILTLTLSEAEGEVEGSASSQIHSKSDLSKGT